MQTVLHSESKCFINCICKLSVFLVATRQSCEFEHVWIKGYVRGRDLTSKSLCLNMKKK